MDFQPDVACKSGPVIVSFIINSLSLYSFAIVNTGSMDKLSEKLFQKNYKLFFSAGGDRAKNLDLDLAKKLRDLESHVKSEWIPSDSNTLLFPRILPNSDSGAESLFSQDNKYKIGDNINQYLNIAGDDPHTLRNLGALRTLVSRTGFDPNRQVTTLQGLLGLHFAFVLAQVMAVSLCIL